jgi:dTMP kinase
MLITFEGIDGSGKSTQISLLEAHLLSMGRKVLCLREPGGTEVSERIRELLLDPALTIAPFAELLLFSAARAQIVAERIKPALGSDAIVLVDRFYDSTTAYQGAGRGVADLDWITSLHRLVTQELVPNRTYWIDIHPSIARSRQSGRSPDRMELGDEAFFTRIHDCYESLAEAEPERFLQIDGSQSIEAIHEVILNDVTRLLSDPNV